MNASIILESYRRPVREPSNHDWSTVNQTRYGLRSRDWFHGREEETVAAPVGKFPEKPPQMPLWPEVGPDCLGLKGVGLDGGNETSCP